MKGTGPIGREEREEFYFVPGGTVSEYYKVMEEVYTQTNVAAIALSEILSLFLCDAAKQERASGCGASKLCVESHEELSINRNPQEM